MRFTVRLLSKVGSHGKNTALVRWRCLDKGEKELEKKGEAGGNRTRGIELSIGGDGQVIGVWPGLKDKIHRLRRRCGGGLRNWE